MYIIIFSDIFSFFGFGNASPFPFFPVFCSCRFICLRLAYADKLAFLFPPVMPCMGWGCGGNLSLVGQAIERERGSFWVQPTQDILRQGQRHAPHWPMS